ncbi:MAG: acetate--CoA ligase family protein [Candidatus Bilamarchaeaceae archaeon]
MTLIDDFRLLEKHGFRLLPYGLAKSEKEALRLARRIGYPVALKIVSPEISHKTDVGGVKLGIKNDEVLGHAYAEVLASAGEKKVDGVLVQKMARKGIELIIGGKKDPQFGHMVILGLGGVYVEIFRDVTARICPVKKEDVAEMITELKAHPLITGARGQKPINQAALEKLIIETCRFITKEDITELDLNPVIFDSDGCDIVDARMVK